MVSKRKGKVLISKELYDGEEVNAALFKLEMKIYRIEYMPFQDWYEIYFTSKYLPEIDESQKPTNVRIEITTLGLTFKEVPDECDWCD